MSEEDRSRLYAWLREQTDEPLAEYLMSCLPAAPLSDLVTKQHLEAVLSAKFSTFELNMAAQREADRKTLDQRLRRIAMGPSWAEHRSRSFGPKCERRVV
ncbi:MAG: hypothetical protein OXI97_08205 [Acidimicrobiaceae bacterium]|nr:hypothetical protein [Acidimicrobiaceae bacterium]